MRIVFSWLVGSALWIGACGGQIEPEGASAVEPGKVGACRRMLNRLIALNPTWLVGDPSAEAERAGIVASCAGIADAPGSLVSIADLDNCVTPYVSVPGVPAVTCLALDYEENMLFPNHDKSGTLADGATCFAHVQCKSAHCSRGLARCGQCLALKHLGDSCNADTDACAEPAECADGKCQLPGTPLGGACSSYGASTCAQPYYCKETAPGVNMDGLCVPRKRLGQSCKDFGQCVEDTRCTSGLCQGPQPEGSYCEPSSFCSGLRGTCKSGVCGTQLIDQPVGAFCDPDLCNRDLLCVDHRCAVPPPPAYFDRCGPSNPCINDELCTAGPNGRVCTLTPPQAGEPCTFGDTCAIGNQCVGFNGPHVAQTGICRAKGSLGDACPCVKSLTCKNDRCVAWSGAVCL